MAYTPVSHRRKPASAEVEDAPRRARRVLSQLLYQSFRAQARGLYRVFNAAGFRFYRSAAGPPSPGDTPFATSATLPYQPAATFADGTWYLSVSYFDGVLDSGFLPLGPHGETYRVMVLAAGALVPSSPSPPLAPPAAAVADVGGGVARIKAVYLRTPDGANAAGEWAIAYTTDGSTPPANTPTITPATSPGPVSVLSYLLPAQSPATTVKVLIQTRRALVGGGWSYSASLPVLTLTLASGGPTGPLAGSEGGV